MSIDKAIVEDFVDESKNLVPEMLDLLESIEGDFTQVRKLADYGNLVDRIMGGAKSLALMASEDHALHMIADYSAVCKAVGYKASQIKTNATFYHVCVGLLLDATETLEVLLEHIDQDVQSLKQNIPDAFIERLHWVSNQFSEEYRMSVGPSTSGASGANGSQKMAQSEIDDLLKKLGI